MTDAEENEHRLSPRDLVTEPPDIARIVVHQQHMMALQHLKAAAYFSNLVKISESIHAGKGWGPHATEVQWAFSGCIMLSYASLDAFYNETVEKVSVYEEYTALIERLDLLNRLRLLLKFVGKPPLDLGRAPAQDIKALTELRHALVHFRPQWHNEIGTSQKLEKLLPKKIESRFAGSDDIFFPRRCVSSDYTEWAVEVTRAFIIEYAERIGQPVNLPVPGELARPK